jgi:hypothetical protein
MAFAGAPFGGSPGTWLHLTPCPAPGRGLRVIPGAVWWRLVYWPWRQYLVVHNAAIQPPPVPPLLAPYGVGGVYFTDRGSLEGVVSPGDFARRVSLPLPAQAECQRFGCAVIEFDVPDPRAVQHGPSYPYVQPGLTSGGAREWVVPHNIALDDTMTVIYIDIARSGPRWFTLPL